MPAPDAHEIPALAIQITTSAAVVLRTFSSAGIRIEHATRSVGFLPCLAGARLSGDLVHPEEEKPR